MSKRDPTKQLTEASDMRYTFKDLLTSRDKGSGTDVKPPSIVNMAVQESSQHPNVVDKPSRKRATVVAEFDIETAAIRANDALLRAISRNRRTRHNLCDEDVETLVHAFAHAMHHKEVYEQFESPQDRAEEMIRRRNQIVMKSNEESYTNRKLAKERQSEECVQMVRMEILSSFDRAGHGPGLSDASITDKAEEFAAESIKASRENYASKAKDEYRHVVSDKPIDGGQNGNNDDASADRTDTRLPVQEISWLFPTDQSATLSKLVNQIVKYNVDIVVPDSRSGNNAATP